MQAAPALAAQPAPPPFRCGPRDTQWERWFSSVFGRGYEVANDGPDPTRLRSLSGEDRTEAESMLRRGLAVCDVFAVQAVEGAGWSSLMPELLRARTAERAPFRARVVVALKKMGSPEDVTADLIEVLAAPSVDARMTAAIGARLFSLERLRTPLLERVRRDPSGFVRYHAADSLLHLADVYPRDIAEHREIASALFGTSGRGLSPFDLFAPPPPSSAELARYAEAAAKLNALVTERRAAGPCPKPVSLATVNLHFVRVSDHVAAVTVEDSEGSCGRTLAFVAFVRSEGGFQGLSMGIMSKRDVVKTSIESRPSPLAVEYQRTSKVLAIGSVVVDTTAANVVGVVYGPKGVAVQHRASQSLAFEHHGGPLALPGLMGSHAEVVDDVRAIVDRSPELSAFVADDATPARR